jgi:hypothetical protein
MKIKSLAECYRQGPSPRIGFLFEFSFQSSGTAALFYKGVIMQEWKHKQKAWPVGGQALCGL